MKAIRVRATDADGVSHVEVVDELCVLDGKCVASCPQDAKTITNDKPYIEALLASGRPVFASLAPSFVAAFQVDNPRKIVAALHQLGFTGVQETAVGAELVAEAHARYLAAAEGPVIASPCPVVVNLVEQQYPAAIPAMSPIVSPMVAHARYIKQRHPDAAVVFIGPCIAKKREPSDAQVVGDVDAVLTFRQLAGWFEDAGIDPAALEPADFDGGRPHLARMFAVAGGLLRAAALSTDMLDTDVITVTGIDSVVDFLEQFAAGRLKPKFVDALACGEGCVGGPGYPCDAHPLERRKEVIESVADDPDPKPFEPPLPGLDLSRKFSDRTPFHDRFTDAEIARILALTGKYKPEDERNCGACGYNSCREKAIAVLRGMADPEMCIPYMREHAQSMADLVIKYSPNGVLVADRNLEIVDMNPAAERMFGCSLEERKGTALSALFPVEYFEQSYHSGEVVLDHVELPERNLIVHATIFPAHGEQLIVGILIDITEREERFAELDRMREASLERSAEVIRKQMAVAQEIAGLLGETTAETKLLLTQLMDIMHQQERSQQKS
jgi:PAS domain S-box-containing protein